MRQVVVPARTSVTFSFKAILPPFTFVGAFGGRSFVFFMSPPVGEDQERDAKDDNRAASEDLEACATGLAAIATTSAVKATRIQKTFGRAGATCGGMKRRSTR